MLNIALEANKNLTETYFASTCACEALFFLLLCWNNFLSSKMCGKMHRFSFDITQASIKNDSFSVFPRFSKSHILLIQESLTKNHAPSLCSRFLFTRLIWRVSACFTSVYTCCDNNETAKRLYLPKIPTSVSIKSKFIELLRYFSLQASLSWRIVLCLRPLSEELATRELGHL